MRHTLATRLLNEGMPITSLQQLLGHDQLQTTLVYARVHNETVQRDYERAQARLTPAVSLANEFLAWFSSPELGPKTPLQIRVGFRYDRYA